ncbi:MAG: CoA-transferase [Porticoccaceae bacterium]
MSQLMSLEAMIAGHVEDGDTVALEGFTHLIPYAAGHEIIRQGRRNLELVRMTPDILYDQMIGMGIARAMKFSWGGNPGVGSLHRFRDAIENGWPAPLEIEEHTHAAMTCAYDAGAANLPFGLLRGYLGTDLPKVNGNIRWVTCPFTDETLAAVAAIRPDVAIIHAQRADRHGNVMLEGIIGIQREAVLSAKKALVTVEDIVDDFGERSPNAVILPGWALTAISLAPGGAHPSYAHGYYKRSNSFYVSWDEISRDREKFLTWMDQNVMNRNIHGSAEQLSG